MDESIQLKLERFFKQYKHQEFKKGEILIRADDDPSGIFFLTNGSVKKYAISRKGEELVINIFKPISFFPMSWAINNSENRYFYEALTAVTVWKAPRNEVMEFVKNEPDVTFDLLRRVYRGIEGMEVRMVYLMSGSAYNRLIAELIICAKRFGTKENPSGATTCLISEKELAAQSGMTRETVSREIKNLKLKNLITYTNGKIIIPSLLKLEDELSEDFNGLSS